jgi:hypothetical protein
MGNYDDNLKGALFKNDKREKDTHPNYRGACEINGEQFWISAWVKEIGKGQRAGEMFMSLSFTPKEGGQSRGGSSKSYASRGPSAPADSGDDLDDQIPF